MMSLKHDIKQCQLCRDRFAATATQHRPKPVVWFKSSARILICGQAPGLRVHKSGKPFTDPSGDRLRDWLDLSDDEFYNQDKVAIVPMAFCFPGYDAKGSDLSPPPLCARTWRQPVIDQLKDVKITLLVGGYAMKWHLDKKAPVTQTVNNWSQYAPAVFPLPHPSWRNTAWLRKNPWFETELLPVLRDQMRKVYDG
jgi:uracil-DNA glycosylase